MSDLATAAAPAPLRPAHARVALVVAVAAAGAVLARTGLSYWNVVAATTAAVLVWVAAIDLETKLLPNRIILPSAALVLASSLVLGPRAFVEHALSALVAGGLMFLAAALRPGDLGMGDVKLTLLLGALLGTAVLGALVIGFCLVTAAAFVLLVTEGRPALKRHLPLGPFLAAGALATLLLSGTA
jgi:prepilin signal peptidase PulO-like enzyme (type II secretory pathway)